VRGHYGAFLFNGKIDRAGVYTRPLTRPEVEALAKGNDPGRDGLLAYWDPTANLGRDGVGDTIPDTGPHGLHMQGINRPGALHDRRQLARRGQLSSGPRNLWRRAFPRRRDDRLRLGGDPYAGPAGRSEIRASIA
jgi:hypothetical protein